jgi:peptide/nickel transport system substrate-binding protein
VDLIAPVPADRLSDLAARYTQQLHTEPVSATFGLVMNTRVPPFNDLAVRRALNFAIDRRTVVGYAGGPLAAQPTCQILPPTIPGYVPYCPYTLKPNASGSWRAPDLARAQRLIDNSGTRGSRVTVLVEPNDATNPTAKVGAYVVSVLDRLGYRASLRVTSNYFPTLGNSRSRTQLGWFPWYSDYPAPSDFIVPLLTCGSFVPDSPHNLNDAEFCSRKIDSEANAASALQANDPGAATQAWSRVDQQITHEAPWLPLYNLRADILTSSRVGNYQYHPFFVVLPDQLWLR